MFEKNPLAITKLILSMGADGMKEIKMETQRFTGQQDQEIMTLHKYLF